MGKSDFPNKLVIGKVEVCDVGKLERTDVKRLFSSSAASRFTPYKFIIYLENIYMTNCI